MFDITGRGDYHSGVIIGPFFSQGRYLGDLHIDPVTQMRMRRMYIRCVPGHLRLHG